MSRLFLADPAILRMEGNKELDQSNLFGQNVQKMYDTIAKMVQSNYVSPAAKALAVTIQSYRDDMDAMTKIINDYGNYLLTASTKVNRNEQAIIDTFKNKSGSIE